MGRHARTVHRSSTTTDGPKDTEGSCCQVQPDVATKTIAAGTSRSPCRRRPPPCGLDDASGTTRWNNPPRFVRHQPLNSPHLDVFAYAQAEGVELRLDATEIQVRRPPASRGGRRAFVSGKKKQNTMKATVIADWRGRTLWTDALRPGRMHDATAARNEGIAVCFQHFPDVEVLLDDGYLGLSRDHRGQAITPPRKPRPGALPGRVEQWERDRHGHSSDRITFEHALADHKRWKQLTRWTHRHDRLPETYRAIAGLVSDRTSLRGRGRYTHGSGLRRAPSCLVRRAGRARRRRLQSSSGASSKGEE